MVMYVLLCAWLKRRYAAPAWSENDIMTLTNCSKRSFMENYFLSPICSFFGDFYMITPKLTGIKRKAMAIILWSLKQHML